VKQRGQTRNYHNRKGTVSSGRRHKFFKRGGEPFPNTQIFDTQTSRQFGTYDNGRYIQSLSQNRYDQIQKTQAAAAAQAEKDSQEAAILNYPEVDQFVQNIKTTRFVTGYLGDNVKFSILKLPQKRFSYSDVQNVKNQNSVFTTINNKTVNFYVSFNGCNVNIYVDGTLYGRVQIITSNESVIDTETVCNNQLANAIKTDLLFSTQS
jgi:hypothetical protein